MQSNKIKQRCGTTDQGVAYEIKICALLALRCLDPQQSINDFWIAHNIDHYLIGNFDDIILYVEYKNGVIEQYCLQLKHFGNLERKRKLKIENFCKKSTTSSKNPFNLLDYYRSITKESEKEIESKLKNHQRIVKKKKKIIIEEDTAQNFENITKYIIFTNKLKDECEQKFIPNWENYVHLLNVNGQAFKIYDSEGIDSTFLQKLTILCGQQHEENLCSSILQTLQNVYGLDSIAIEEIYMKYIQYITDWRYGYYGGFRVLYKAEIQIKLAEILLQSYILQLPLEVTQSIPSSAIENWTKITSEFKVVLVENYLIIKDCEDLISQTIANVLKEYTTNTDWKTIFSSEDELFTFERCKVLNDIQKMHMFWGYSNIRKLSLQKIHYFLWTCNKLPLILRCSTNEELKKVLKLVNFSSNQCIIFHKEPLSQQIECEKTFASFHDLNSNSKRLISRHSFIIQGRTTSLKHFVHKIENERIIRSSHIAQIVMNNFKLDNKNFKLSKIFINRTLSSVIVNPNIFREYVIYVISCNDKDVLKEYLLKSNIVVHDSKIYNWRDRHEENIEEKLKKEKFDKENLNLSNLFEDLDQFKLILTKDCDLTNTVETLRKFSSKNINFEIIILHKSENRITIKSEFVQEVNVFLTKKETFYNFLNKNCIKFDISEVYDITNMNLYDIPFTCKYIICEDDYQMVNFDKYSIKIRNVHFYKLFIGDNDSTFVLVWVGSYGDCEKVKKFKVVHLPIKNIFFKYSDCFQYNNLNVIVGSPGMGKSVIINYLISICPPNFWTILINFNDHWKYFNDNIIVDTSVIEFIKYFVNWETMSKFSRNFMKVFLRTKQICLFFDGFDEVDIKLENKICNILEYIISEGFVVFMSTRPIKKYFLEMKLKTIARELLPFTENEQFNYISEYFKSHILNCKERIDEFVENLLNFTQFNESIWDKEFSGIPLQTKMISDLYLEHCKEFCRSGKQVSLQHMDVLYLYENFITFKIKHLELKDKIENSSTQQYFDIAIRRSLDNHMLCAIKAIFPDYLLQDAGSIKTFTQEIIDGVDKIGLIEKINDNEMPVFVHRTFAEYLVGLYMSQNISNPIVKDLLLLILNNPIYDVIRNIFDRLLAVNCSIHIAFLNGEEGNFIKLLKNKEEFFKRDFGGRTILHLSMACGARHNIPNMTMLDKLGQNNDWKQLTNTLNNIYKKYKYQSGTDNFVKLILEQDVCYTFLFQTDIILNFTPLDYCITVSSFHSLEYFLTKIYKLKENFNAVQDSLKRHYKYDVKNIIKSVSGNYKEFLFISSLYDYPNITSSIIELKPELSINDVKFGVCKMSLLHFAARYNSCNIIHLLINEGCDVNAVENCWYRTPIFIASARGHNNVVKLLVEKGANISLADIYGHTPLYSAAMIGHKIIKDMLLDAESGRNKTKITKLFAASTHGDLGEINMLLQAGENVNEPSHGGTTPFIVACIKGNFNLVKLLLDCGADVNSVTNDNRTGLMYAAQEGHLDVVKHLLSIGANRNVVDKFNSTALTIAIEYKHLKIVDALQEEMERQWKDEDRKDANV